MTELVVLYVDLSYTTSSLVCLVGVIPCTTHSTKPMPRGAQVLLQTQNIDLLLHLPLLELQRSHVPVIDVLLLNLLRRDGAHKLHERLACLGDGLGGHFEPFLRLGHEVGLDPRRRDELRGRARHLVRRDDELFERVRAREHAVGGLDEQVGRERDRARGGDQAIRPPVVPLVELLRRARALALRDDLLLRLGRGLDQAPDRGRDRQRGG